MSDKEIVKQLFVRLLSDLSKEPGPEFEALKTYLETASQEDLVVENEHLYTLVPFRTLLCTKPGKRYIKLLKRVGMCVPEKVLQEHAEYKAQYKNNTFLQTYDRLSKALEGSEDITKVITNLTDLVSHFDEKALTTHLDDLLKLRDHFGQNEETQKVLPLLDLCEQTRLTKTIPDASVMQILEDNGLDVNAITAFLPSIGVQPDVE